MKTGLLLLVILFFLGCKKEKNKIGLNDPSRLPTNTYFTDTFTIKSEVILVKDSINTTNVSSGGVTSYLFAGAYHDDFIGNLEVQGFTQLRLLYDNIETPGAVADSAYLYLNYSYYYGDTTQSQVLNVHKLTGHINQTKQYYSNSPAIPYDPSPIGSVVFNATSDSAKTIKIKITDTAFLQSILDASKNGYIFATQIPGIALIPGNNTDGAVIRIDGSSVGSAFNIFYTQNSTPKVYYLTFGSIAKKFYRAVPDFSAGNGDLAGLSGNYDSINTNNLSSHLCYIQSLSSLRMRFSFPYLKNIREAFPNLAVIQANLVCAGANGTECGKYQPNSGLVFNRTEYNDSAKAFIIKKDASFHPFYVQPDDYNQTTNTSVQVTKPVQLFYSFSLKSYMQAILLNQIPNNTIILSPALVYTEANRFIFYDNKGPSRKLKLNMYFTTTK